MYKINNVEVSPEEIRKLVKDHPEILKEKSFEEEMVGKKYWFINSEGKNEWGCWENSKFGNNLLSVNNIFFSEAECDKEITRRKALGRIMKYIRDNNIELVKDEDWGDLKIKKYQILGWDYTDSKVNNTLYSRYNEAQHNLAFYTEEDLDKVVKNYAEDLKTLLKR